MTIIQLEYFIAVCETMNFTRAAGHLFVEGDPDMIFKVVRAAFGQRRKQLGSIFKDMVQSTARAEELSNADWVQLAKGITENENT